MYTITEFPRPPLTVCYGPRLFFSIYYKVDDDAFKKAAQTWRPVVQAQESFTGGDVFYEKEISTEQEFKAAWEELYAKATNEKLIVWAGHLFTHSSKQNNGKDGLEFKPGGGEDGTVIMGEISGLKKLPWNNKGFLILAGCNSGIMGSRGWCPADVFAKGQGVKTLGQVGFGYFSDNWNTYNEKLSTSTDISLWAYKRGLNGAFGNGERIPAAIFGP